MRTIKLSELNAQPKYQAFVQRFIQAAHIECGPNEAEIDVLDETGDLLVHYDASGDVCITTAGRELYELADFIRGFDDTEEEQVRAFSQLHKALIEVHLNGFASYKTPEEGYVTTLCRFKD